MPEGPEHYKAAVLINSWCKEKVFSGKIIKSAVNIRNPEIQFNVPKYKILAKSRGKEVMLTLTEVKNEFPCIDGTVLKSQQKQRKFQAASTVVAVKSEEQWTPNENISEHGEAMKCNILFQFGMSGKFEFTSQDSIHKHSHLRFVTDETKPMILSFVDTRRFGKWQLSDTFSEKRGPDPVYEYKDFRRNVLENLQQKIFKKPICVVMHDQKYFNGLGNYLRAEILHRAKIPPFEEALSVLDGLAIDKGEPLYKDKGNGDTLDFLELCSVVPYEVMKLEGVGYDPSEENNDHDLFMNWLQCYGQPGMNNLVDNDGRTIWFQGVAGKLAPSQGKTRRRKHKSKDSNIAIDLKTTDKVMKEVDKSKNKRKKREGQKDYTHRENTEKIENKRRITDSNVDVKSLTTTAHPATRRSARLSTRT